MVFHPGTVMIVALFWAGGLLAASGVAAGAPLATGEYRAIRETCLEILERFPPQKYWYVGVGRSPTPFLACIEAVGVESVTHLPWSGIKGEEISEANAGRLRPYFRSQLPDAGRLGGRTLLVLDYLDTGESLKRATALIQRALESAQEGLKVRGLSIEDPQLTQISPLDPRKFDSVLLQDRALARKMHAQEYRGWARYREFRPTGTNAPERNPAYDFFADAMRREMENDRKVAKFRQRLNGVSSSPCAPGLIARLKGLLSH